MRILHVRSSEFLGSAERLIIGQIKQLTEFDFCCATFGGRDNSQPFRIACRQSGIETIPIKEAFSGDWRVIRQLRREIDSRQIDILVTHDYKSNFFGYFAAKDSSAKQIAVFHGVTWDNRKVTVYNWIDRRILRRVRRIIAVSKATAEYLLSIGIEQQRISVVPNAIEERLLKARSSERQHADYIRVVAAGRFSFEKGFDMLLEAVARLRDRAPRFRIYLYGAGPEEARLRKLVADRRLEEIVEFGGLVGNLPELFDDMDLMVMPSRSEGMPVVLLEAWARQLPVIATAVGGVPELIEDGRNGLLIEPLSVDHLVERLGYALDNPDQLRLFGQKGYQLVMERYTFRSQAPLLADIYRSCQACP